MRGEIRNREFKQINDFSGLRYGTITPTDIDGLVEFGGRLFVLIELKYGDAALPVGQRLALSRLAELAPPRVPFVVLVARHYTDIESDIPVHLTVVSEIKERGKQWRAPSRTLTVREAIDALLRVYAPQYLRGEQP